MRLLLTFTAYLLEWFHLVPSLYFQIIGGLLKIVSTVCLLVAATLWINAVFIQFLFTLTAQEHLFFCKLKSYIFIWKGSNMKKNLTIQIMGHFLFRRCKKELSHSCRKSILTEYDRIISNAKDIGKRNLLLSAYAMGAWFIAMNREDDLSPEKNCQIMMEGLRRSRLFRIVMGDADHYLDPKRIEKQRKWARNTHRRVYENDWVVDLLPGNGTYDLGYDYLECGICKLCRDEGCPELAKYLCHLDYLFAEVMGLHLERTSTLAEGGKKCDFRFSRL